MNADFDQTRLGSQALSGDLTEDAKRATMIAAPVSGFDEIEIGSAVDARSRDHASNPAGCGGIAQKLSHAKAMEREDRRQVGTAKGYCGPSRPSRAQSVAGHLERPTPENRGACHSRL
jgi:hypothetical protein